MVAGSNPNGGVSTTKYPTEYRIEYFQPPYMSMRRPSFKSEPKQIDYGQVFTVSVTNPGHAIVFTAVLMDLGFHTHAVSLQSRHVTLVSRYNAIAKTLSITGPPNTFVYPPGPAFLYILGDGIPSNGTKILVGNGANPPSSATAFQGANAYSEKLQADPRYRNETYYVPPYVPGQ